jgi:hypothetical protein
LTVRPPPPDDGNRISGAALVTPRRNTRNADVIALKIPFTFDCSKSSLVLLLVVVDRERGYDMFTSHMPSPCAAAVPPSGGVAFGGSAAPMCARQSRNCTVIFLSDDNGDDDAESVRNVPRETIVQP